MMAGPLTSASDKKLADLPKGKCELVHKPANPSDAAQFDTKSGTGQSLFSVDAGGIAFAPGGRWRNQERFGWQEPIAERPLSAALPRGRFLPGLQPGSLRKRRAFSDVFRASADRDPTRGFVSIVCPVADPSLWRQVLSAFKPQSWLELRPCPNLRRALQARHARASQILLPLLRDALQGRAH